MMYRGKWTKGIWHSVLLMSFPVLGIVAGCTPDPKQMEARRHAECLNKHCDGDVQPPHDRATELAFKRNGRWYVGPLRYGDPSLGAMSFFWPSKIPTSEPSRAPEHQMVGQRSNFYEVAIEVFLIPEPNHGSMHAALSEREKEGAVLQKESLRPDLEMWTVRGAGGKQDHWFIATNMEQPSGGPPVIHCRDRGTAYGRCTGGFTWEPDITANLRFSSKHAQDWPEVYAEVLRLLNQIRKV